MTANNSNFKKCIQALVKDNKPLFLAAWNFSHFSKFHWHKYKGKAPTINCHWMLLNSGSCFFFHECTVSQHSKSNKCLQAQAISQQSMDHESVQDNSKNMHKTFLPRYHIHRGRGCPKTPGWSAQRGSWVGTTNSFKNPTEKKDHCTADLKILKKKWHPRH